MNVQRARKVKKLMKEGEEMQGRADRKKVGRGKKKGSRKRN